jgi:hypothetical protein
MKKSLKKLSLNKKAISSLTGGLSDGGSRLPIKPIKPTTTTDPTELTWCYHCPQEPIDTLF